jgi:hypothetical protein
MAMHLMMLAAATAYQSLLPPALAVRGRVPTVRAVVTAPTIEPVVSPPTSKKEMLAQAVGCIKRAKEDGNNRYILRLFLPRGPEETLIPCDESWEGGIMQLFSVASPLIRELLMSLSTSVAGVPPKLREQRLDASGVDGESVWLAESSQPQDDAMGFVQPSTEQIAQIQAASNNAGERPILLCNPQWKERDDPLDALSRKEGLLGTLGNFLGGKASTEASLVSLGFRDVYTLATYRCRGSLIFLQLAYPYGWTAFYREGVDDETWKPLLASEARPTYQSVEEALVAAGVPFRLTEFDSVV